MAANARQSDWTSAPEAEVYLPFAQRAVESSLHTMTFVVRTSIDPASVATAIPRELAALDRTVPVTDAGTMAAVVASELWRERLTATLTGVFAMVALVLAAIGVYAVVAYSVARRTREFGVRVALGATAHSVVVLALVEALRPVAIGSAVGLALAASLSRIIQTFLYDVSPLDPLALSGAVLVLVAGGDRGRMGSGAAGEPPRSRDGAASRLRPSVARRLGCSGPELMAPSGELHCVHPVSMYILCSQIVEPVPYLSALAVEENAMTTLGARRTLLLLPLIMLLVAPRIASAQFSGVIQGTITDGQKAVVADAIVMVTNTQSGVTREATTTSDGVFRVLSLGPGTYRVEVVKPGFLTATREAIPVGISETVRLDFTLEVSGVQESVTVTTQRAARRDRAGPRVRPRRSHCSSRRCRSAAGISTT